jgi:hypothetical protein
MHKGKRKWLCLQCGGNTSQMKEHYFVKPEVWYAAHSSEAGMLCVACLEGRLGRELNASDFTGAHINDPRRNAMSALLRSRVEGVKVSV